MRLARELGQVSEAPVSRSDQSSVGDERRLDVGRSLRDPDREHERLTGPLLPGLAEVVHVWVALAVVGAEHECGVTDDEPGIGVVVAGLYHVANLGVAGKEARPGAPDILEQQLEQRDAGHRAATDDYVTRAELTGRTP